MGLFRDFKNGFTRISTTLDVTERLSGRAESRSLHKTPHIYTLASLLLLLASCGNESTNKPVETPKAVEAAKSTRVVAPDFNADSAYAFIKAQADMGPRTPGSKAHEQAVNYFEKKFKSYGAEVTIQKATVTTFDNKKWICKNVIASFNPENPTRVLLSAE